MRRGPGTSGRRTRLSLGAGHHPGRRRKSHRLRRAAGDHALSQLAPTDAVRWFEQALSLLAQQPVEDERSRAALLVGLGNAQRQIGDSSFRETLLAAGRLARHAGDTDSLVAAALANNRGIQSTTSRVDTDRVAIIEAALAAVGDADSSLRARLLGLLALERTWDGDLDARRAVTDEALAIARRLGDPATLDVLLRRFQAIWHPDTVAERLANTTEAEALADLRGDPVARYWSANLRAISAAESADLAEFARCQAKQMALATETSQPTLRWLATWTRSAQVLMAGDAAGAEALADEVLRLGTESGQPDAQVFYGGAIVLIRWHQGRTDELIDMHERLMAEFPLPGLRGHLARVYVDAGRDGDARALLAGETATRFGFPEDAVLLPSLLGWSETAARLQDPVAASILYERLTPWTGQASFQGGLAGAVAHYLADLASVLGRYDAAERNFADALALHERLGAPFHIARTHLEWGRMLLARGELDDRAAARAHLESARDLAQRYGCALVDQRGAQLLSRC